MTINPDLRLKVRHFILKHRRIVIIIIAILVVLIIINRFLLGAKSHSTPQTTYQPNIAVLDTTSSVPTKVANSFESFIEKYIGFCNNKNYVEAYNMISDDCKKNFFDNSYDAYVRYVKEKFNGTKRYAIQDYSNLNGKYIYTVKIFDDFLATGLTNQSYKYQEEKITASYDENKNIVFSVGNYIEAKKLNYMASNDYLKVEVKEMIEKYSFAIYKIKFTNRSDYTIVIKDGLTKATEVGLIVGNEVRNTNDDIKIILEAGESKEINIAFPKFYDSGLEASGIVFDAVRVMENYTGLPENADNEIRNAIEKFSMRVVF